MQQQASMSGKAYELYKWIINLSVIIMAFFQYNNRPPIQKYIPERKKILEDLTIVVFSLLYAWFLWPRAVCFDSTYFLIFRRIIKSIWKFFKSRWVNIAGINSPWKTDIVATYYFMYFYGADLTCFSAKDLFPAIMKNEELPGEQWWSL